MSVRATREFSSSEGPSTVRTTTYESRTNSSLDDDASRRPLMGKKTTIIQRTSMGPARSPGRSGYSIERSTSNMSYGAPSGAYAAMSSVGVDNVKTSREREKKDMQDLNERFASYIEKVRFLEAQNRKLAQELENLKNKWGKETAAIKAMYQAELDEARKLLDEAEKEKGTLEIKCTSLEQTIDELRRKCEDLQQARAVDREKIERSNQQLSEYESEINLLRRRVDTLETDRERDKKEIQRLTEALNRARIDLDNETLNHIDAENRRQTLEEELEFMKQVHEQEMKELAALAYRDTTAENREFWKNEMAQCLREISNTYDEKLELMRGELETYYNLKMQEFRTGATRQNMETQHAKEESKRLKQQLSDMRSKLADLEARNAMLEKECDSLRRDYEEKEREWQQENDELKQEVAKLRAEMEAILKELQNIMDTKLGLELEIAAYRKLLEGEENRVGLRQVVESFIDTQTRASQRMDDDDTLKVSQVVKGEMSAKTTYQRSAKGPVAISECSADGRFIALENTGKKIEDLSGWRLTRNIDNDPKKRIDFSFASFSLRPSQKAKV
ncbi:DgyrCDS13103 [Dimorphilus gyrociliatus]|nr:DgyrCDS13103 [Dimorphilus gyrociliatus]